MMTKIDKRNILLFGGTFDPIHNGHLIIAGDVAKKIAAEKIFVVVAATPPHKDKNAVGPADHRLAMAKLAVAGDERFEVSDCELARSGPSYTLDTVNHFRDIYADTAKLYWLIGADMIGELASWYKIAELFERCTIVTAARPGYRPDRLEALEAALSSEQIRRLKDNILQTPLVDISASEIRHRATAGRPIGDYVANGVREYIEQNKLYR